MKQNPDYVVRITGSDTYGKSKLDYFISVGSKYPVIATTSKLLSTGSDCKMTKLIVLDEMIGSMTEFKQIIGRGTRLREKEGKTHFVVMDFRNVSRLFADPDWDGPIEMNEDFDPEKENDRPVPKKMAAGWRSSTKLFPFMMQVENCSGRKALLTTRKKISVARTLHWTILSVNGLLKKRKKKSGSFFWSMVLTLKH